MKANEISDRFLLKAYSDVLKEIEKLYRQKKELETEIASRNEQLEYLWKQGKIKMEREVEE